MANIELKYQILLKMKVNMGLDPKTLEGDRIQNETAIFELEDEGFVKITRGAFAQYGRILICFLTDRGVVKQQRLLETIQKSKAKIVGEWCNEVLRFMANHIIEVIIGVAIAVLSAILTKQL
jgi:hypothetical protein